MRTRQKIKTTIQGRFVDIGETLRIVTNSANAAINVARTITTNAESVIVKSGKIMNDDLVSILTTFYREYDSGGADTVRLCGGLVESREDIERHLALLQEIRTDRLELYASNFRQIPEDLRFFGDLINEISREVMLKTTEDQKFVINGLQLKALMRLAAVGRSALSDLTGGNKDA